MGVSLIKYGSGVAVGIVVALVGYKLGIKNYLL